MNYKKLTPEIYDLAQGLLNVKKDKDIKFIYIPPEWEKEAEKQILEEIENNTLKTDF